MDSKLENTYSKSESQAFHDIDTTSDARSHTSSGGLPLGAAATDHLASHTLGWQLLPTVAAYLRYRSSIPP